MFFFYFIIVINSFNKCNLWIDNLYMGYYYCIKSIDLIIGKEEINFNFCINLYSYDSNLYINCLLWIVGKLYIYFNKLYVSNEV